MAEIDDPLNLGWIQPVPNVRVGIPQPPDPKVYQHLTERERMEQGFPYIPSDPALTEARAKAHKFNHEFNSTLPSDVQVRKDILKKFLHPSCADKYMYIEPPFRADYGDNIIVGNNFYANFDCVILDSALVTFGDDCLLAPGVHIYTATHPVNPVHRRGGMLDGCASNYYELAYPIKIGHTCWIGGKAVICPGVTIGDNVVIGAGSVVTKNVPSNVVIAGNPAKIVRYLDEKDVKTEGKK